MSRKRKPKHDRIREQWLQTPMAERIQIALEYADDNMSDGAWLQWVAEFACVRQDQVADYLASKAQPVSSP